MTTDGDMIVAETEAARMLCLSPRTLQRLRTDGGGPPIVRLTSRRIGYRIADLHAWAQSRITGGLVDETRGGVMAPVALFPQPPNAAVLTLTYPRQQRQLLWALLGASHPMLPLDRRGEHALATLRVAILGALRHGDAVGQSFLTSTADIVTDKFATEFPFAPRWRGGFAPLIGWGVMHATKQFQSMASVADNSWARRLRRAADTGDQLVELIDDAEGGVISCGGHDPEKPPPTSKELDAAWRRFEQALKNVCGALGLLILVEPGRPEDGPDTAPPVPVVGVGGDRAA